MPIYLTMYINPVVPD